MAFVGDDQAVPGGQLRDVIAAAESLQGGDIDGAAQLPSLDQYIRTAGTPTPHQPSRPPPQRPTSPAELPSACGEAWQDPGQKRDGFRHPHLDGATGQYLDDIVVYSHMISWRAGAARPAPASRAAPAVTG
jgi:hypothetical protein